MHILGEVNIPVPFLETIHNQLDEVQSEDFIKSLSADPATSIRKNPYKSLAESGKTNPIPWCSTGCYLNERPSFTRGDILWLVETETSDVPDGPERLAVVRSANVVGGQ